MATTQFTDTVTVVMAAWLNDVDNAAYAALTGLAGTNTITGTGPANFAYAANAIVRWIPAGTNTGATTINITPSGASALGAKNVFSNGAACIGDEIVSGVPTIAIYDGTQFNLVGIGPTKNTLASTWTFNGSGGSTGSVTMSWQKTGKFVTLYIPAILATTGTSSSILTSNTALPAGVRPVTANNLPYGTIRDNGADIAASGSLVVQTDGTLSLRRDSALTNFTNASSCGSSAACCVTYSIA